MTTLDTLLTTLAELEIEYKIKTSAYDQTDLITGNELVIELPHNNIKIHVSTTYWRHPGIYSFFVNYHDDRDNFSCHAGTMRVSEVIYLIGYHAAHK